MHLSAPSFPRSLKLTSYRHVTLSFSGGFPGRRRSSRWFIVTSIWVGSEEFHVKYASWQRTCCTENKKGKKKKSKEKQCHRLDSRNSGWMCILSLSSINTISRTAGRAKGAELLCPPSPEKTNHLANATTRWGGSGEGLARALDHICSPRAPGWALPAKPLSAAIKAAFIQIWTSMRAWKHSAR